MKDFNSLQVGRFANMTPDNIHKIIVLSFITVICNKAFRAWQKQTLRATVWFL